ncbi:hypothetical protein [Persicobacter psychrovividus]|uniref:Uncharacterized protein n=1 Tax=Persicobacter psychrovividus TaxID=387638 RepID=A0ABN6LH77_9BACT|nr:hypothetical protein PEPS_31670 [Persicobacter psychrovividus]
MRSPNFITSIESFIENEILTQYDTHIEHHLMKADDRIYVWIKNGPEPLSEILNERDCAYQFFKKGISLAFDVNIPNKRQLPAVYNTIEFRLLPAFSFVWIADINDLRDFWDMTGLPYDHFAHYEEAQIKKALPYMSRIDILKFLQWYQPQNFFTDWVRYSSDEFALPLSREAAEEALLGILLRNEPLIEP